MKWTCPVIATLLLTVGCPLSEEDEETRGACFKTRYSVWDGGSSFDEECDDDISESTCEAWEYTDGTTDASTTFYANMTCEEAGY
jgi:hypothetical protein